jgi:hep/hag repeat protein
MNNKILLTGLVLASLAGTSMAAGVGNTVDLNAAGYGAEAYGKDNAITETGTSAFAVGFENTVSGANSFAYGHKNTVTGANSFAGGENSEAKGYSSLAIGSSAQALSDYTFAIGSQARANGANTVAVGNGAYASNDNALAMGYSTAASGKDSLAVGSFVKSNSDNNVAIGTVVTTNSNDSVGIGTAVTTNSNNSVGIGNNVVNNLSNSIGIGNGVATDFNTIGIGNGVETKVKDTIAIGNGVISKGESSVAIGNDIHADGVRTVNIGTSVSATGVSSIVVGRDTTVKGDDTTVVGANNGTIEAAQSAVYGYNNVVQDASKEQLIFGVNSTTKEQGSTIVGSHSKATAVDSLALGNNTIADVQNGVAIGTNSVTESPVGTTNIKDNTTDIRFSNSTYAGSNPNSVVSFGTNGRAGAGGVTSYTRQLQNLAAGRVSATSTDGINGSQLYDVALEAQKYNTLVDGTNTTVESKDNKFGRKEYKVNVNKDLVDMDSVNFGKVTDPKHSVTNKDGMITFDGDKDTKYTANGIAIEDRNNLDTASYNLDGMVADSNGKHVEFTTNGINAGDQIINNVKAGVADTDAVNVSQLKGVQSNVANNTSRINDLGQKVNTNANDIRAVEHTILDHEGRITVLESGVKDLDNKINSTAGNVLNQSKSYTDNQAAKVGANAAALSALHPLDFNADEKWQFSVGFGNYKGKNATALGAFYQPNENVLLSVGTTLGTGENMVNAGATVRFGSHSSMNTNKQVAVAKEVQDLKLQLSAISQKYDNLVKNLSAQKAGQDVDFEYSDLPKDHWAYDFVKKLSDKGYLNGYPDGTFKGDAKMTRYEFATALWRAVNNGAIIDAQMAKAIKEFEPELEEVNKIMRYRIDTVAGKDNSVHKTERLRVNKNDDPFTHMKRDDYGTKIYTNK